MHKFNYKLAKSWIEGRYGIYRYKAKLKQGNGGIAGSNVVRLSVYCGNREMIHYDEGWFYGKEFISIVQPIVEHLEKVSNYKFTKMRNYMKGMF